MVALFEVKQKVLQLVVQRIVVEDHRIIIEHTPSGLIRLQPEHHAPAGPRSAIQSSIRYVPSQQSHAPASLGE
jgi:hypothetical protein